MISDSVSQEVENKSQTTKINVPCFLNEGINMLSRVCLCCCLWSVLRKTVVMEKSVWWNVCMLCFWNCILEILRCNGGPESPAVPTGLILQLERSLDWEQQQTGGVSPLSREMRVSSWCSSSPARRCGGGCTSLSQTRTLLGADSRPPVEEAEWTEARVAAGCSVPSHEQQPMLPLSVGLLSAPAALHVSRVCVDTTHTSNRWS